MRAEAKILTLRFSCLAPLLALSLAAQLAAYTKSGSTYTTNGSQSDVSSAISASTAGETVLIPAGNFTWGASGTSVAVNKAITLQGSGTGSTTITLSTSGPTYGNGVINVTAAATIMDFSILGNSGTVTAFSCPSTNGWRITNINYTGGTGGAYFVYGESYGLIDNCTIAGSVGNAELIFVRGPSNSWQTASSMGTANALYVENCTFNNDGYVCDANSNARMVVRFCTINGPNKIDGHGVASNTPPRSVRHMEVYGNTWTATSGYNTAIEIRGGTGMIFDNTSANTQGAWFFLTEYGATGQWPNFGNQYQTPANYPIADQIGVGMDPKVAASEPLYAWNNTRAGSPWQRELKDIPLGAITLYGLLFTEADIIAPDRDFFWSVTNFTGASGIGRGTKAQMLAITPTKTGVGYWVTDEGEWNATRAGADGQLYRWNGSSWVLKYKPYAYPHPLRSGMPVGATTSIQVDG